MGTGKHLSELSLGYPVLDLVVQRPYLGQGVLVLDITPQFDEDLDVIQLTSQTVPTVNGLFQGCPLPQRLLRRISVIPEPGLGDTRFQFLDILPLPIYFKETPEGRLCALPGSRRGLFLLGTL
jgi:hypothetical protein